MSLPCADYLYTFYGGCRLGDVLETINQVDLACASHHDAVKAVKESSGPLSVVSSVLPLDATSVSMHY